MAAEIALVRRRNAATRRAAGLRSRGDEDEMGKNVSSLFFFLAPAATSATPTTPEDGELIPSFGDKVIRWYVQFRIMILISADN